MKTKDLIKLLKESDPSGESYVWLPELGIPYNVHMEPGYWNGPFSFIDNNGNYITTTSGYKIIIDFMDIETYIENNFDLHVEGKNKWEEISSKFKFNLESLDIRMNYIIINDLLKNAEEKFNEIKKLSIDLYKYSLEQMIEKAEKGWKWYQDKKVDNDIKTYTYYHWIIIDENGNKQSSNIHMTEPILFSGLWKKTDNDVINGYYEWVYKK